MASKKYWAKNLADELTIKDQIESTGIAAQNIQTSNNPKRQPRKDC
jgi:hypothetical protein